MRWVERRFGFGFDPVTEMLPLIGSKEGLSHLPFAVVNPGDATIIPEPGYQAYIGGSILAGAARVTRVRGLGLAIAKRLCDLQSWRLAVRSPLEGGRGTAFTLSFAAAPPAPA